MLEIKTLKKEYKIILNQLANPELISDWEKIKNLSKRKNFLEKIINKEKDLKKKQFQIKENEKILKNKEDRDLYLLAKEELKSLKEEEKKIKKELENLLNEKTKESKAVIIEIRAGTGGEEAALFAADLFRMYSLFAQNQNWEQTILNSHPSDLGGFKEIIFELNDERAFSKIKYEAGVHRVQRIPETEKSGRVHTSTVTVAVLPKPSSEQIKIRPEEIKVDFFKSSGPGGQNVNKRETAVRITHLSSGITVTSQTERNQARNKENALSILRAKLLERNIISQEEQISGARKNQIKGAKRAEKIRTYNFPQNRLTDHRIKKSWHNLEEIMSGKLELIINELQKNL